jgi:hypothetical protein
VTVALSVLLLFTPSDYLVGIIKTVLYIGRKSKKDRQCHGHTKLYIDQFDDANGVIIGRKSKKDRQCHGHTKLDIEQFDDTNGLITPLVSSNCSISNLV